MRLSRYRFGEFQLDAASRELTREGRPVALPPKSFECLAYLIAHRDRAVGRDELIAAVWGRVEVSDTVVAQTMLRARKALDDTGDRQAFVRTVPRFGYQWIAPAEDIGSRAASAPPDEARVSEPPLAPNIEPVPDTAPSRSRWGWWVAALCVALAVLGGWFSWTQRNGPAHVATTQAGDLVLVLPVAVAPNDADNAWVRLGAMDYIASRLRRSGLKVVPSDQSLRLGALAESTKTRARPQALHESSGARWVFSTQAMHDARGWRVRLDVHDEQSRVVEARGNTALTAAAAATDAWLRRIGRTTADEAPSALIERLQQVDAELFVGQIANARRLIETAPASQRTDPRLRLREGQLAFRAGRVDEAARLFASILQATSDDEVRAEALMGSGAVDIRRELYPAAEAHYGQALSIIARGKPDDPVLEGNAYNGRGVARVQQGDMDGAVHDMSMARIAMQRSGDLVEAATVGVNLGRIETQRGHLPQALQELDRAIAVFQRFDVRDYLAAAWMTKAEAQLVQVQPADAAKSMAHAATLAPSIEDPYLSSAIARMRATVALANGRLREAAATIDVPASAGDDAATLRLLRMRLALARGAVAEAAALARQPLPADAETTGTLAFVAVQGALRDGDVATARRWIALEPKHADGDVAWDLSRALLADATGDRALALRLAREAATRMEREGTPEHRVQAGVLQARLFIANGERDAAAAILGDLDAFADTDYRVAWGMLALYRGLGEAAMASSAESRVRALQGERDVRIEPAL